MTIVKIDDKEYDTEMLSDDAKAQLLNVQLTDQEIQALQVRLAIAQTARIAYANALGSSLALLQNDTIKFN